MNCTSKRGLIALSQIPAPLYHHESDVFHTEKLTSSPRCRQKTDLQKRKSMVSYRDFEQHIETCH